MPLSIKDLNFASGELAPALHSRSDNARYASGLKMCRNWMTQRTGGVANRPGTYFACELHDSTRRGRLLRFQFNPDQTYVLLFEHLRMRVVKLGGLILTDERSISGLSLVSPLVVTAPAHGFNAGDQVYIREVLGTVELNGRFYRIDSVTPDTFALYRMLDDAAVDGSAFTPYLSGGLVSRVFELATPYQEEHLQDLRYVQSADVITIVHPQYPPMELRRTGEAQWSLVQISFKPPIVGPTNIVATETTSGTKKTNRYKVTAVKAGTLEESLPGTGSVVSISAISQATEGIVTTSAVHGFFSDDQVVIDGLTGMTQLNGGTYGIKVVDTTHFKLNSTDTTAMDAYVSGGTATRLGGTAKTGNFQPTVDEPVTVTWDPVPGAVEYNVFKELNGVYGFLGVARGTEFKDVGNVSPDTTDTPPEPQDPFPGPGDYPSTVTYFQQRLIFANTDNKPEHIFASASADFHNFSFHLPQQDDDSFTFPVAGREVNEVNHLLGLRVLIPLTTGGEWTITGDSSGILTPASHTPRQESFIGSSALSPVVIGNNALFVQREGHIVHDLKYSFTDDGYSGSEVSVFSHHLIQANTITDWAFAQNPNSIVWMVRDDGMLLGMTYLREQEVIGWHRHDTEDGAGFFENVVTISEEGEDTLYAIVRRTVGGLTKRYVERFASRTIVQLNRDEHFVDCGLGYDGTIVNESVTLSRTTSSGPPTYEEPDTYPGTLSLIMGQIGGNNLAGTRANVFTLTADDGTQLHSATFGATSYDACQGLSSVLTAPGTAAIYVGKYCVYGSEPGLARYALDLTQAWQKTTLDSVAWSCAADAAGVCVSAQPSGAAGADNYILNALCYNAAGALQWGKLIGGLFDSYRSSVLLRPGHANPVFITSNGGGIQFFELDRSNGNTVSSSARFTAINTAEHAVAGQLNDIYVVGDTGCVRHADSGTFANLNTLAKTDQFVGLVVRPFLGDMLNYVADGGSGIGDTAIPIKQNVTGTGDVVLGDYLRFSGHTTDYKVVGSTGIVAGKATLTITPGLTATVADGEAFTLVPTVFIGEQNITDAKVLTHRSFDLANEIASWTDSTLGLDNVRSVALDVLRNVYIGGKSSASSANYRVKRITDVTGRIDDLFTTPYTLTSEPAEPWKINWIDDPAYVPPTPSVPLSWSDPVNLTSSSPLFTSRDVGNVLHLTGSDGSTAAVTIETVIGPTWALGIPGEEIPLFLREVPIAELSMAAKVLYGLEHLEGKTVAILNDGNEETPQTVVDGKVTLARPGLFVHVGLPYVSRIQTLQLENPGGETLVGKTKNVAAVSLMLLETRGLWVGPDFDNMRELQQRSTTLGWGETMPVFTGTERILIPSLWDPYGSVCVEQRSPLPATILAIVPHLVVGRTSS